MGWFLIRYISRYVDMTYSTIFDEVDKPKRKRRRKTKQKQSVLWTVYHTILAVELLIIIIIEEVELLR